jgi:tRNA(Ile)-lysidine synthase
VSFSAATLHASLEAAVPQSATGLVVGLSGGQDSASLLSLLVGAGKKFRELPLRAVHVDHGLQKAAAQFRSSCASLCELLGVPLTVISVAVDLTQGVSVEEAARDARYAALTAELAVGECLLTAHHRNDQAETLLLQALRGAGLKGLSAMPACVPLGHAWHVRPLLDTDKSALSAFAAHAPTADDPMNRDTRFDRVYLRREIWPLIETRWPGAGAALSRAARHVAEAQDLLDESAAADVARLRDGEALSLPGLRALDGRRRVSAVRYWLCEAGVEPPSTARLTEGLRQMLHAEPDQLPYVLWGEHALRRYRQRMFVTGAQPPRLGSPRQWQVAPSARIDLGPQLGEIEWVEQAGGLDASRLPSLVTVRSREGGETLKPAPLAKTQSIQHLCQSFGILPWLRDALPLVFAGGALTAIADLWLDTHACAAPGTKGLGIIWRHGPIIV